MNYELNTAEMIYWSNFTIACGPEPKAKRKGTLRREIRESRNRFNIDKKMWHWPEDTSDDSRQVKRRKAMKQIKKILADTDRQILEQKKKEVARQQRLTMENKIKSGAK